MFTNAKRSTVSRPVPIQLPPHQPGDNAAFGAGSVAGIYSYSQARSSASERKDAVVDVERGTPLPEHACVVQHTNPAGAAAAATNLPLLLRVERCCLESRPAEIETAIATLSKHLGTAPGETAAARNANGCVSPKQEGRGTHAAAAAAAMMSPEAAEAALTACRAALRLCRGEYEEILRGTAVFSEGPKSSSLAARVRAFVVGDGSSGCGSPASTAAAWRAAEATWAGAAALSLFLQENYAGPELGADRTAALDAWFSEKLTGTYGGSSAGGGGSVEGNGEQDLANVALACDGELPYPQSSLAGALVAARTVLTAVAGATAAAAAAASSPDDGGGLPRPAAWSADGPSAVAAAVSTADEESQKDAVFGGAVGQLSSAAWWSGRACVTHARLLISSSGRSDTLWREALGLFGHAVGLFGGGVRAGAGGGEGRGVGGGKESVTRRMSGLVWLEWGLAQHHFQVRGSAGVLFGSLLLLFLLIFPPAAAEVEMFVKHRDHGYFIFRHVVCGSSTTVVLTSNHPQVLVCKRLCGLRCCSG